MLLTVLLVTTAVVGGRGGASAEHEPLPPVLGTNLIAYVDLDGRIATVSPDGSSPTQISPDGGFFTWPMWSPDARQLVFSGFPGAGGVRGRLRLYYYRSGEAPPRVIYTNEVGMGPILGGMPHYTLWAPDSGRLALMASAPRGLTLFVTDPHTDEGARVVIRGAPLYATWSPDSRQLLVHGAADHFLADASGGAEIRDLEVRAPRYRVPAWRPFGEQIAYVSEDADRAQQLYVSKADLDGRTLIDQRPGGVAFLWSPDGESLAVARSDPSEPLVYRQVLLCSADGARQSIEIREDIIAFFWAPDSNKLAYLTISSAGDSLGWSVLDLADGERWPLVDFRPSGDQLTIFRFFDQFAHSHHLWSPDSSSLVFAGALVGTSISASLNAQEVPRIFVIATEPLSYAEPIADGTLAVWSPR